jgi:NAD(P)-dependent dehydrogenase (short-subunit alcohol dehydrogenase family)
MAAETRLRDKVAIITGSGSGIGRATAIHFASQGAKVACADIDRDAASETAALISLIKGVAHPIATDVSNHKSSISMVSETAEEFGRVDILYANAGIHVSGSVTNTLLKDWQRVMSVNLTGLWLSNQAVIPMMLEQGYGSIINQSSISALSGFPGSAAYAASKGAVISLTRQAAIEYSKQGIRINVICPGAINTPLLTKRYTERMNREQESVSLAEEALSDVAKKYPIKSIGSADDVAQMAVFLASDESRWVTGAVFPVDGGFSAM